MRKLWLIAVVVVIALTGTGCSQATGKVDKVGLHYDAGPIEGTKFNKVILNGSGMKILGISDTVHWLPINQRTYIVSKKADEGDRAGSDSITAPAKGGVPFEFEISTYFKLNTATNDIKGFKGGTARKFYEQICVKYHCDTSDKNWDKMLNNSFRKIIETSMRQKVFNYTPDELYANAEGEASGKSDAILKIQAEIAASIKDNVNKVLGGQYFCGPTFDRNHSNICPDFEFIINSAEPPAEVKASYTNRFNANNNAQAKIIEAEGTKKASEAGQVAYNSPGYIEYLRVQAMRACADNPKCTLVITSGGTNINVGSRAE